MGIVLIIILIILLILLIAMFAMYNTLVRLRNRVKNAWSQIDVQLKKRYDLLPNLIETVKGYMHHEANTLTKITELRSQAMSAKDIGMKMKANTALSSALGNLKIAFENYPDLKASKNFLMLQEELSGIENKIAYSRQFYNDSVMLNNNKIEMFPTNIVAGMFGFKKSDFFEAPENEKKNIKVSF